MLKHVASWRASGLTQTAYCLEVGLKPPSFNYWVQISKEQEEVIGFVEIAKASEKLPNKYEIVYPNGVILRLHTESLGELACLLKLV